MATSYGLIKLTQREAYMFEQHIELQAQIWRQAYPEVRADHLVQGLQDLLGSNGGIFLEIFERCAGDELMTLKDIWTGRRG